MAARTRKVQHDDETRRRIRTTQLLNRLKKHALGKLDLAPTQVKALEILLKKALPDLQAVEITGQIDQNYIVHMPSPVVDLSEWRIQEAIEPDETVPALPKPIEGD